MAACLHHELQSVAALVRQEESREARLNSSGPVLYSSCRGICSRASVDEVADHAVPM